MAITDNKTSALVGISENLSTLERAQTLQDKAAAVGFEWKDLSGLLNKLEEEIGELKEAALSGDTTHIEEELGDVMFVLVNFARMNGLSAEAALQGGNEKFERRFRGLEDDIAAAGQDINMLSLAELTEIWRAQKEKER